MAIVYLVRHGQAGFGAGGADAGSGLVDDLGGAGGAAHAGNSSRPTMGCRRSELKRRS